MGKFSCSRVAYGMFDLRNHVSEQVVSISVKFVVIGSKSGIFDDGRTEGEVSFGLET
jgi:hypothetical protein